MPLRWLIMQSYYFMVSEVWLGYATQNVRLSIVLQESLPWAFKWQTVGFHAMKTESQ